MSRARTTDRRAPARGVASLLVVVILLAVMATGVLFTNRNLIVEQKTSANQYRSTMAAEAAEAGLEWAISMMNKQEKINTACNTSGSGGDPRFKAKYFTVDAATGALTPRALTGNVHAACVANPDGTPGFVCSCPAIGSAPSPAAGTPATGYQPSFAVAFVTSPTAGTTDVVSYGCTSRIVNDTCTGDAAATVRVTIGPVSAMGTPSGAALTARGRVDIGNAALGIVNGDPTTNGITINAGMGINAPNARLTTVPGTPPLTTLVGNDASLRDTTEDQMFATYFGMSKDTYKSLPSVKQITCPCTETTIQDAYTAGGGETLLLWLNGNLSMNANITLGTVTDPILLVVDGSVEMRGDIEFYGVIYSSAITWDNTGGGGALLQGAAISEGNYSGNGTPDYVYDPRVLQALRAEAAAYGRVPGSWRDFGP